MIALAFASASNSCFTESFIYILIIYNERRLDSSSALSARLSLRAAWIYSSGSSLRPNHPSKPALHSFPSFSELIRASSTRPANASSKPGLHGPGLRPSHWLRLPGIYPATTNGLSRSGHAPLPSSSTSASEHYLDSARGKLFLT